MSVGWVSEQAASWDTEDCPKQQENDMANQKQVPDVQVSKGITATQSNEAEIRHQGNLRWTTS